MKPSIFSQVYIHLVFSPKSRDPLLVKEIRENIFAYIGKTITNKGHKAIIINGMPDHIHILIGLNPTMSISDLVRDIKRSSSLYINEQKWFKRKFNWQEGYGVFSYGRSSLNNIYQYIKNQEKHHAKKSFQDEYQKFLELFEIEINGKFLFNFQPD